MADVIEVGTDSLSGTGPATVYRNGKPIKHFKCFEDAMRYAYPDWQPHVSYEAALDNRA